MKTKPTKKFKNLYWRGCCCCHRNIFCFYFVLRKKTSQPNNTNFSSISTETCLHVNIYECAQRWHARWWYGMESWFGLVSVSNCGVATHKWIHLFYHWFHDKNEYALRNGRSRCVGEWVGRCQEVNLLVCRWFLNTQNLENYFQCIPNGPERSTFCRVLSEYCSLALKRVKHFRWYTPFRIPEVYSVIWLVFIPFKWLIHSTNWWIFDWQLSVSFECVSHSRSLLPNLVRIISGVGVEDIYGSRSHCKSQRQPYGDTHNAKCDDCVDRKTCFSSKSVQCAVASFNYHFCFCFCLDFFGVVNERHTTYDKHIQSSVALTARPRVRRTEETSKKSTIWHISRSKTILRSTAGPPQKIVAVPNR